MSNATLGILRQTMTYAVRLGYFLCQARRLALDAGAETGGSTTSKTAE